MDKKITKISTSLKHKSITSQPRQSVEYFRVSKNTLDMMDQSMISLNKEVFGATIDLSKFKTKNNN